MVEQVIHIGTFTSYITGTGGQMIQWQQVPHTCRFNELRFVYLGKCPIVVLSL
jgi:hypothetical protein